MLKRIKKKRIASTARAIGKSDTCNLIFAAPSSCHLRRFFVVFMNQAHKNKKAVPTLFSEISRHFTT